jgi:hypothetical protein
MVEEAHKRQLAMRFEVSALEAAVDAGRTSVPEQYAYALAWLAEYAAGRVLKLSRDAAGAGGTTRPRPTSPTDQGAAGPPIPPPKWQDKP